MKVGFFLILISFILYCLSAILFTIVERKKLKSFSKNWICRGLFLYSHKFENKLDLNESLLQNKLNNSRVASAKFKKVNDELILFRVSHTRTLTGIIYEEKLGHIPIYKNLSDMLNGKIIKMENGDFILKMKYHWNVFFLIAPPFLVLSIGGLFDLINAFKIFLFLLTFVIILIVFNHIRAKRYIKIFCEVIK